jgi:hypothetical protein
MLPNAEGLNWIDENHVLFSEIKQGIHMVLVTAGASRTGQRDIYVPPTERGMAHHSALSPDGRQVLMTEMGSRGEWLPCRLVPFDGSSSGVVVGPKAACRGVGWSPDGRWMYLSADVGTGYHLWRQRRSSAAPEQITFGPSEEQAVAVAPDGSLLTSVGTYRHSLWLHLPGHEDREISEQGNSTGAVFSPDGTKLVFMGHLSVVQGTTVGHFMILDLRTWNVEDPFPDLLTSEWDISPSGKLAVLTTVANDGVSQLWLAALDRRSPPKLFPSPVPVHAGNFVSEDEIVFRTTENGKHFVERAHLDGTGRHKVFADPIITFGGLTPDMKWALVGEPTAGERSFHVVARRLDGSRAFTVCSGACGLRWSPDNRTLYIFFYSMPGTGRHTHFVVAPTAPGSPFPAIPPEGLSAAKAMKLPGAKTTDSAIYPSNTPGVFAFNKDIVHRNIYRIPVH